MRCAGPLRCARDGGSLGKVDLGQVWMLCAAWGETGLAKRCGLRAATILLDLLAIQVDHDAVHLGRQCVGKRERCQHGVAVNQIALATARD